MTMITRRLASLRHTHTLNLMLSFEENFDSSISSSNYCHYDNVQSFEENWWIKLLSFLSYQTEEEI